MAIYWWRVRDSEGSLLLSFACSFRLRMMECFMIFGRLEHRLCGFWRDFASGFSVDRRL